MAKNLEAARALERAAERHPLVGADSLYEAIGTIYLAEGDLDKASDAFQARVDVSPNNAGAHRRFGEVLLQRSRHDEALAEFEVALLIDSNDVQAYAGIAQLRLQQGDTPKRPRRPSGPSASTRHIPAPDIRWARRSFGSGAGSRDRRKSQSSSGCRL